ncbi:pyridoxal phosphate-dependent aminotransferase [Rouxiella badensis]|uniref:cysteine-S-conjugate beta-lyase n=1 Tax=Rouxiella badensis TaxID=1646377 RepID=A0A1X0WH21_9GAMM|nr:MalY/PatB family protein [Rouxiella badensis]MCC3718072.1 pyridoxal phosphate-dependent aminotransferase [Rouxiella badensis]MCC3727160.1 pyridoxal phosphate-dependent aminotransferase [Rouxiella badensis]MCC3738491.1 pyridoxal phosphate-dependent aminotransferase [Rouxiella badensis]ORJ26044.1 transcriptional regulator [Rouxiella badensis]
MFDFDTPVDRQGTWCTQWDYIADRFGRADLLPFTISDMDFATAPCILEALQKRLSHGVLGYSRWQHPDFTGAIAHWYQTRFHCAINPEALVYGPSVIYMVAQLIRQWSAAGDSVLIFTPAYDAFYKTISGNQRKVISSPLQKINQQWEMDLSLLETQLAEQECKILLLCSPHNPTGKVWTRQELVTIDRLCQKYQVKVISDEIHMDMVWGKNQHLPWSSIGSGHWALVTSGSKTFNIPALTGAYGLINHAADRAAYLQQLKNTDGLSSPAVLSVLAHITAYTQAAPWLDALRQYLEANLSFVARQLNDAFAELDWQPPQSTYLAWIDLRPLNIDDEALQTELIERQGVAMMPGITYGEEGRGFLRLNVGCSRAKLEKGVEKLIAGLQAVR